MLRGLWWWDCHRNDKRECVTLVHSCTLFLHCKSMSPTLSTSYFPVVWLCQETSLPWPLGTASPPQWRPLRWDLLTPLWVKWRGVGGWASSSLVRLCVWVQSEKRGPDKIKSFTKYTGLLGGFKYSFCRADIPAIALVFSCFTEK